MSNYPLPLAEANGHEAEKEHMHAKIKNNEILLSRTGWGSPSKRTLTGSFLVCKSIYSENLKSDSRISNYLPDIANENMIYKLITHEEKHKNSDYLFRFRFGCYVCSRYDFSFQQFGGNTTEA
jgi:hypothetical protein